MSEKISLEKYNKILKDKIYKWLPKQARVETAIDGLMLSRYDEDVSASKCFYRPAVGLVLQGTKRSIIGKQEITYGENYCVTVGVDLPGTSHIINVSQQQPFIALAVELDRRIIAQLITEMPSIVTQYPEKPNPIVVAKASEELLKTFIRLLELLDTPSRIPVFAPMLLRELHFHLLTGSQGGCLRLFSTNGTQANQIALAISWLRENYAKPFHVEELAQQAHMGISTFHRHFRQVTNFSPLQFQKKLRLYEAERLMLVEGKDASTAALMVGYESDSQFNREYKRQFGEPPHRDVIKKMLMV